MKLAATTISGLRKAFLKKGGVLLILTLAFMLFSAKPVAYDETYVDAHTIVYGMFKSIDNIKTLQYLMISTERVDDSKIKVDSSRVKSLKSPRKIFMKMSDGDEVLWVEGSNNNNAWVHPNSFPYITLALDPDGAIMRKNQHHGVHDAGYDYFKTVLKEAADKAGKNFDDHFLYLGEIMFDGVKCYNVMAIDKDFHYIPYTVQKGENVLSIAKKFWVNEYMLMDHNNLSSLNDVNTGQTIMIPSDYGKLITLYINKTTMLPLLLRVDDEKGLFEQYVFKHIKIDPPLTAADFSKSNKEYHFE